MTFPAPIRQPSTRTDREHGIYFPCVTLGCMGEDTCTYCGDTLTGTTDTLRTHARDCAGDAA